MKQTAEEAAEKWVFETNGHKWSNNDNTAGDNFASFIAGAKWQKEQDKSTDGEWLSPVPTFSQAFRWFREKYNLHSLIGIYPNTKEWYSSYQDLNWSGKETLDFNKTEDRSIRFKTYEEAELACLKKLIEIVETKQQEQ
jgi:hypothetical protein